MSYVMLVLLVVFICNAHHVDNGLGENYIEYRYNHSRLLAAGTARRQLQSIDIMSGRKWNTSIYFNFVHLDYVCTLHLSTKKVFAHFLLIYLSENNISTGFV